MRSYKYINIYTFDVLVFIPAVQKRSFWQKSPIDKNTYMHTKHKNTNRMLLCIVCMYAFILVIFLFYIHTCFLICNFRYSVHRCALICVLCIVCILALVLLCSVCKCDGIYDSHKRRCFATHCRTPQHTAKHCNTATHCNTLQHTATHCNTLQ